MAAAVAAAVPDLQSPVLDNSVITRQRIFSATDAAHDHKGPWATAGGGILVRALAPAASALSEDVFIQTYSTTSADGTRYTNADTRKASRYDVPFYPRTDAWSPGFVFAPFGLGVPWLTAHDAGSSHPGQRPCLHFNLADTAARLRSKASKPVFCRLPNLFLSAADLGTDPTYVEAAVFYGFSLFTGADWRDAAMDSKRRAKSFNPQKDGGKVKCKILVKMSPAANGNFAWYDLTDTGTAPRPQSFGAAVAAAKWKVLNMNAGYFMGNENSEELFTPDEDPAKVLLATIAKILGDMTTAIASSEWMARFHPGGPNAVSPRWFDAWTGGEAPDVQVPIDVLGESGDRLQIWQGSDRNGATLYTGSRQDENKMQIATFTPGNKGLDPAALRQTMINKLDAMLSTMDNQYSTLLAEIDKYIASPKAELPMAYDGVKPDREVNVTSELGVYLQDVKNRVLGIYETIKTQVLEKTQTVIASGDDAAIKKTHDDLMLEIVELMPQKTSFFIGQNRLHKAFQIARGYAVRPSPNDAITKINTRARYGMGGGASPNDLLDIFAVALRISMPPNPADEMFVELVGIWPDRRNPSEDVTNLLRAINRPIPLCKKWEAMLSMLPPPVQDGVPPSDAQLWQEIEDSYSVYQDDIDNAFADQESLALIRASVVQLPTPATNDTEEVVNFIGSHFVPYGVLPRGVLPPSFSDNIVIPPSAAAPPLPPPIRAPNSGEVQYAKLKGLSKSPKALSARIKTGVTLRGYPGNRLGLKKGVPPAYRNSFIPPPIPAGGSHKTYRRRRLPKLL